MQKNQKERKAGVLMPVSSLPSDCGIGTLGAGAYAFVDWLYTAGMKIWQVLPLLPTGYGDSPYQSCASDAVNPYFIDFALLVKEGLLEERDYKTVDWCAEERRVDYGKQFDCKISVLRKAFENFDKNSVSWKTFLTEGKYADYALFMSLKTKFSYAPWTGWVEPYRSAEESALQTYMAENKADIEFWQFTQYIFLKQWNALKSYATEKGIKIMGDMPIYVASDSVETWKYRKDLFMLDGAGNISLRAGVPPDAFSEEGQLWGNPVYDWEKMKKDGYSWWRARIAYAFQLFDIVRIDHFRAFDRFYVIPANAESAKEGEWLDGPKAELFEGFEDFSVVAEDLGCLDEGVYKLMEDTGYPGMKVFEFAFNGDPENEYLPSNFKDGNCVAYTGTHDNETLRSFIEKMGAAERKAFEKVFESECLNLDVPYLTETVEDECRSVIELLFASKAEQVIVPMHDLLCLGEEARLNAPSTVSNRNWTFRFVYSDFGQRKAAWLKALAKEYNR
ncbi:MAG: 4-alpha-glucanotransferase [Clostridia bacterium]|nr:4-alpha-glucanotransferase [Clostridia bacterium]